MSRGEIVLAELDMSQASRIGLYREDADNKTIRRLLASQRDFRALLSIISRLPNKLPYASF